MLCNIVKALSVLQYLNEIVVYVYYNSSNMVIVHVIPCLCSFFIQVYVHSSAVLDPRVDHTTPWTYFLHLSLSSVILIDFPQRVLSTS